jgi:biotin transport system substrate-specific component
LTIYILLRYNSTMNKRKQFKIPTKDLCFIAIFVAIIAALAQLAIPMPLGVPLTMQTFAIMFSGATLGAKRGAIAAAIYVLLGAVGAPVFAGFNGGFHVVIGPTGGYIWSFPILAFLAGLGADLASGNFKRKWYLFAALLVAGFALNLSLGMLQLALVLNLSFQAAFLAAVLPFIVPEIIKATLVFVATPKLRQAISMFNDNKPKEPPDESKN